MYNSSILTVHKQATPLQYQTAELIQNMLSHGIIHASHVAGLLSLFDGVTKAIDVQVPKTKEILSQTLSSFLSSM
jgi:hypothetical protein